jgi:hypothetical protein
MKTQSNPAAQPVAAHTPYSLRGASAHPSPGSQMWEMDVWCPDSDGTKRLLAIVRGDDESDARESAAFVVRACNSHAALVAALEGLLKAETAMTQAADFYPGVKFNFLNEARVQARAALAAARHS